MRWGPSRLGLIEYLNRHEIKRKQLIEGVVRVIRNLGRGSRAVDDRAARVLTIVINGERPAGEPDLLCVTERFCLEGLDALTVKTRHRDGTQDDDEAYYNENFE